MNYLEFVFGDDPYISILQFIEDMSDDMSDEEVSYSVVKYRKAEYYIDECEPPNVYQITDDEDVGDKIGTWEKNNKGKTVIKKLKNGKK